MLIENRATRRVLDKIIGGMTSDPSLRQDLRQEALIHLWSLERETPRQTTSWYLQSCRFHLQHLLASGKSVDALKRRSAQMLDGDSREEQPPSTVQWQSGDAVLGEVSARDMISLLMRRLGARQREILMKLSDGFTTHEISLELGLTHQAVSKHRRRIAALATNLGIRPVKLRHDRCRAPDVAF